MFILSSYLKTHTSVSNVELSPDSSHDKICSISVSDLIIIEKTLKIWARSHPQLMSILESSPIALVIFLKYALLKQAESRFQG